MSTADRPEETVLRCERCKQPYIEDGWAVLFAARICVTCRVVEESRKDWSGLEPQPTTERMAGHGG